MGKKGRYDDTEYMFSSARIRAMENRVLGKKACERLIESAGEKDVANILGEYGCDIVRKANDGESADIERTLAGYLKKAFDEVSEMLPKPDPVVFLRYKYDCNNIKYALKCKARGISPSDMLFDLGTVSPDDVVEAAESGDFSAFPENMRKAAAEAYEAYIETKDPRKIDFLIDRACFADEKAAIEAVGFDFGLNILGARADLLNMFMCVRMFRMKAGENGRKALAEALTDGGTYDRDFWLGIYDTNEEKLWSEIKKSRYQSLGKKCEATIPLYVVEREIDGYVMGIVKEAAAMPFGAELSVAYLIGIEYAVKNIRIILACKEDKKSAEQIRERLREMYV